MEINSIQNLNSNEENGNENKNGEEKVSLSKEEYERLLSSDKKVGELQEKYNASTKEAQKLNWIAKVSKDEKQFIKLYNSDKKQAEEVAKHFWKGDAKTLYDQVVEQHGDVSFGMDAEDVDARIQLGVEKRMAEQELQTFKDKYGIDGKLGKVFDKEFKDLMQWKEFNVETVKAQAKKAFRLVRDTDEFVEELKKANSRLAGAGIVSTWRNGDSSSSKTNSVIDQIMSQQKGNSIYSANWLSKDLP